MEGKDVAMSTPFVIHWLREILEAQSYSVSWAGSNTSPDIVFPLDNQILEQVNLLTYCKWCMTDGEVCL